MRPKPFGLPFAALAAALALGGTVLAGEPSRLLRPADAGDLERLLDRFRSEERALAAELAGIDPSREMLERRVEARGKAYYRRVRAGLLPSSGGFDALVDHAARVERLRRSLERDLAEQKRLGGRALEIEERLARLRAERAPLEVQREAMESARVALAQAEERRAAFARAFEGSSRPPDYLAIYGADLGPTDEPGRAAFASRRGRLPMPVAGRAEIRRVTHPGSGGPGLEIVTTPGASVRAVAPGRVAFADVYDAYGLTVLIDHGDRYFSLVGNLGSAEVAVGDQVAAGARLGRAVEAQSGAARKSSMVYFELREGAVTVDPSAWLGL